MQKIQEPMSVHNKYHSPHIYAEARSLFMYAFSSGEVSKIKSKLFVCLMTTPFWRIEGV